VPSALSASSLGYATSLVLEQRWRQQIRALSLREGMWLYSRIVQQDDPAQGWKIHVSATVVSAAEVFSRALPVLREHDVLFKVPAKLSLLAQLNFGSPGFSQIGKFITIYPRSAHEAVALARKLHVATRGEAAPEIPFDLRYRRNSLVYYRYGAFAPGRNGKPARIFDETGKPHADRRAPGAAVPAWLNDPFRGRPATQPKATGPIGLDYIVFKAFAQRGKGGVFEALDLSVSPARLVVIKQGRRHGDTDWMGEDGFTRVKREGRTLRVLHSAGIPVPKVYREFRHRSHYFLVLEKVLGRSLLPPKREHPAKPSPQRAWKILREVGTLLSRLHAAGWVWRDCKPSHIFLRSSSLRAIDFEGACRINDTDVLPWASPNYVPPSYRKEFARRRIGIFEDDYALGVICFQFVAGEFPPASRRTREQVYRRTGCPKFLRDRIERLLAV